jgi:hypothetical protein
MNRCTPLGIKFGKLQPRQKSRILFYFLFMIVMVVYWFRAQKIQFFLIEVLDELGHFIDKKSDF